MSDRRQVKEGATQGGSSYGIQGEKAVFRESDRRAARAPFICHL